MGTFLRAVTNAAVFCCVSGLSMSVNYSAFAKSSGLKEIKIDSKSNGELRATKHYAPEPLQIYVSLDAQRINVFRGLQRIQSSKISSGKDGHDTPRGIFSVLEKRKKHQSNIYNNASMPYMQRLTWSGIALHESNSVPNYPASHGCIRLPSKFAKYLFGLTSYRDHVIISPENITPRIIDHPALFQPHLDLQASFKLRDSKSVFDFKTAPNGIKIANGKPLKIYITRQKESKIVTNVQLSLRQLLIYEGEVDGAFGKKTRDAILKFQKLYGYEPTVRLDKLFRKNLAVKSERSMLKDGVVFVRQNQLPIYQADIEFIRPFEPLGSHFFTTYHYDGVRTKWIGSTISTRIPKSIVRFNDIQLEGENRIIGSIYGVLGRIKMPNEVKATIEKMLTAGSSLSISDNGLGTETGKGTDFIVQTH